MRLNSARALLATLLTTLCALLAVRSVVAARDRICDDGSVLSSACGIVLPDPEHTRYCAGAQILSLQRGCFVCVSAITCRLPGYSKPPPVPTVPPVPVAVRVEPGLLVIQVDHDEEKNALAEQGVQIYPQHAAAAAMIATTTNNVQPVSSEEVSDWFFVAPALLALVSVGMAIRGQIERAHQRFELLGDQEQEEINPFCGEQEPNPQADGDDDLECGEQYNSDDTCSIEDTVQIPAGL